MVKGVCPLSLFIFQPLPFSNLISQGIWLVKHIPTLVTEVNWELAVYVRSLFCLLSSRKAKTTAHTPKLGQDRASYSVIQGGVGSLTTNFPTAQLHHLKPYQ